MILISLILLKVELVFLQETWTHNEIYLEGYKSHSLPAYKSKSKGRCRTGLTILCSIQASIELTALSVCSPLAQAFLLKFLDLALIIINVYIPPCLNQQKLTHHWNCFTTFVEELEVKFPLIEILLAGDFNARVGKDGYALSRALGLDPDDPLPNCLSSTRCSKDLHINDPGISLAKFCIRFDRLILNGSSLHDWPGEFTFASGRGSSVIDYILVPPALKDQIEIFCIGDRTDSDHFPLMLTIKPSPTPRLPFPTKAIEEDHITLPRISWSQDAAVKIDHLFTSNTLSTFNSFLNTNDNPSKVIQSYDNIITGILNILGSQPYVQKRTRNGNLNPWFDTDCCQLKSQIRSIYHTYRDSNSQFMPVEYFHLKKKLHQLIKVKQSDYLKKQWELLIQATISNNTRQFWALVSGAFKEKSPLNNIIPSNTWYEYYLNIFHEDRVSACSFPEISLADTPEWPPVMPDEVRACIDQLKPRKAPGPDAIPPELLKTFPEWWASLLAALFTVINKTGLMPDSWTNAILVPVFKKGDRLLPSNYRPISLLSIVGKLYARLLSNKLILWMSEDPRP